VEDAGIHRANDMVRGLKRTLYRAARALRDPRGAAERRSIRREVTAFVGGTDVLRGYLHDLADSGLRNHLVAKGREAAAAVQGTGHSLGAVGHIEAGYLYAVLRHLRPQIAVETGVANGFSTAYALLALEHNGEGHLHSIDWPREVGREYEAGEFYEGEGRAGIPPGSEPGWLIPSELRQRWMLTLGRTQDELPPLLDRLGTIDSFMHDSEHSFDCMWFEFNEAWPHLRAGGLLFSDDVNSTEAFPRFAQEQGKEAVRLARGLAFLQK
jgi:Methyltransferase domain